MNGLTPSAGLTQPIRINTLLSFAASWATWFKEVDWRWWAVFWFWC